MFNRPTESEGSVEKSRDWLIGWHAAEEEFYASDDPKYENPYWEGTDSYEGYEAAVYTFTNT